LVLLRHGQTEWNAQRRIQGQSDVPLDDTGREQAAAAARRLAGLKPSVLITSDLSRCADTAAELAGLTGLTPMLDERLRERAYGEWQGCTLAEIERRWPAAYQRWRVDSVVGDAGVEETADLAQRVLQALRAAVEQADGGTAIVVTHGGAARRGIGALLDWPDSVLRALGALRNCHWTELAYDTRGWRLTAHNRTSADTHW
jgi:probable phosphoglycerate mutase